MHVISRRMIREFLESHRHSEADATAFDRWYRIAKRAEWVDFASIKGDFPAADRKSGYVIFDIGGNKYRIIAEVNHVTQKLYLRHVLTHAEYDDIEL